jgi:hypothetical protein
LIVMQYDALSHPPRPPAVHRAKVSVSFGKGGVVASVRMTSGGILSIGALVSGILLSTAVLVRASARGRRGAGWPPRLTPDTDPRD